MNRDYEVVEPYLWVLSLAIDDLTTIFKYGLTVWKRGDYKGKVNRVYDSMQIGQLINVSKVEVIIMVVVNASICTCIYRGIVVQLI